MVSKCSKPKTITEHPSWNPFNESNKQSQFSRSELESIKQIHHKIALCNKNEYA